MRIKAPIATPATAINGLTRPTAILVETGGVEVLAEPVSDVAEFDG
jgi:hypothetical protein